MKFLVIASLSLFVVSSFAADKDFTTKKKEMSSKIDQKIEALNTSKTCVNGAKDEKALKKCKDDTKEAMEHLKGAAEEGKDKLKDL